MGKIKSLIVAANEGLKRTRPGAPDVWEGDRTVSAPLPEISAGVEYWNRQDELALRLVRTFKGISVGLLAGLLVTSGGWTNSSIQSGRKEVKREFVMVDSLSGEQRVVNTNSSITPPPVMIRNTIEQLIVAAFSVPFDPSTRNENKRYLAGMMANDVQRELQNWYDSEPRTFETRMVYREDIKAVPVRGSDLTWDVSWKEEDRTGPNKSPKHNRSGQIVFEYRQPEKSNAMNRSTGLFVPYFAWDTK